MKTLLFSTSAFFLLAVTSCGQSDQNSSFKHYPVKSSLACDSEVSIPGDPHAKVHAVRAIIPVEVTKATIMKYETRAMNVGTAEDLFSEHYRTSLDVYSVKKGSGQNLELYVPQTLKLIGTMTPIDSSAKKMTLKLNDTSEVLTCSHLAK